MTKRHWLKFYVWNFICAVVRPLYTGRYIDDRDVAENDGNQFIDFNQWLHRRWFVSMYTYEHKEEII